MTVESLERKVRRANRLAAAALVVSVIALVACGLIRRDSQAKPVSAEDIEQRVYDRLLGEVSAELKPVYRDFEIEINPTPTSFSELIKPLTEIRSAEPPP